ncbi:MAG: hypothetical protein AAGB29_12775 [Planctomycetota bacterium]
MIEIVMIIAACVLMWRVAAADDHSPIIWMVVTLGICLAALLIPLPFIRIIIAVIVAFGVMIAVKAVKGG